ncbi:MAG: ABC transporter substrate-binding protein [Oscillospiraceae bacterium]|nr:ABC transporter substrate-binding protein [Oscillospiraceae bacterium]MBQ9981454.1 ABC transporter substrate-binding protein [Oscillospiraceae bacterium]
MKSIKKSILLISVLAISLAFTSCGFGSDDGSVNDNTGNSSADNNTSDNKDNSIYYLNFKPEVAQIYEEIAKTYKQETGVTLNVVTAASGTYEQTLKSEIAKADAPAIFQINGPKGYASWKNYCADLSDTEIYQHLTDKELAIKNDDGVYGIPYVVEGYGIIYNEKIMDEYFELDTKQTDVDSVDEINNFETLSAVVEDMTANKDKLGIDGVFASTSLKSGDDWRWHTHLANIPLYYEFLENNIDLSSDSTNEIEFSKDEGFKNIFDLYINNSTVEPKILGTKQTADSMAEFALGQCAMVQNGNWAWEQINDVSGNTVNEDDIGFLPIFIGEEGEENQGIAVGTENFLAINSQVSEEKQKLASDFLYWLYSSEKGKDYVINELGFIAPFDTFSEDEKPTDPLAREVVEWIEEDDVTNIPWNFTIFPSQNFKDEFGTALLQYVQGKKEWTDVKETVVEKWKAESK